MSIAWSLKPVLMFAKTCGIPTIDIEPKSGNLFCGVIALTLWRTLSFICLLLNCFLNIYRFVKHYKRKWICDGVNHWLEHKNYKIAFAYVPLNGMDEFEMWVYTFFMIGVPSFFNFQCLCTRKFRKILSSIRKIDERVVLTAAFYRKCRRHCIFLIIYFLIVRSYSYEIYFALYYYVSTNIQLLMLTKLK